MKIVCISDTHDRIRHDWEIPSGDILIHAGDFTIQGLNEEVIRFNKWLGTLPHQYKIVIPGNHELKMDEEFNINYLESRALITNATLLVNESAIIGPYKFYGMPDTPEFCNWAFNRNQSEMEPYVNAIPDDIDVLITHGPPYGHLDTVRQKTYSLGCKQLLKRVMEIKPKLHVFGHIHGGYGTKWFAGINFVNAAICNEAYKPVNQPIVVEI